MYCGLRTMIMPKQIQTAATRIGRDVNDALIFLLHCNPKQGL